MTGSRDDAAEDEAAAGNRESTSQLEAFLDSAADPLRARRTSGSQTGSTALTGRGSQVGSVLTGRGSQGSAAGPLDRYGLSSAPGHAGEACFHKTMPCCSTLSWIMSGHSA